MRSAKLPAALPAPVGWTPQTEIVAQFPTMTKLRRAIQPEIRSAEVRLDQEEAVGRDMFCLRQIVRELRWRLEYTADAAAVLATFERLHGQMALPLQPSAANVDEDGSCAAATDVWF